MTKETFGEFLSRVRTTKLRLTREAFAEKVDISPSHLYNLERGIRKPSRELVIAIARELNTSSENLFKLLVGDIDPSQIEVKPKSRIPDLPPDPPLEPELVAALNDPRLGKMFYSKQYLARLSNADLRQLALDALTTLKEIEDFEASEQQ